MKIFQKKSILQKTILVILTVLVINFIVPTYSHADIGGVLLNPIMDLIASIGDVCESLMQYVMTGNMSINGFSGLKDASVMVDQGDIPSASGTPDIKISTDDLDLGWFTSSNNYEVPDIRYSPEEIFSNKTPFLDINFISPTKYTFNGENVEGTASRLQDTISKWYVALRNLALVILLSVLVYVGIRMIISSTASDKAKYKQMFMDWLIAMCLLFFLHYIMSFTLTMVDAINQAITGNEEASSSMIIEVTGGSSKKFSTNIMGAARFMVQSDDSLQRFSYLIIYLALIIYTGIFTFAYLKRLCTMAFLTIIAPMVAVTYPIDKMNDGKAQAFDMWLKEYVFNALIQPFHLIIYTVLLGTAMDLAKENPIFVIAVLGFLLPAEKILRKFFGFEKAGTLGALQGFAAASALNKLTGGSKGGSKAGGSQGGEKSAEGEKPPKFDKKHDINELEDGSAMLQESGAPAEGGAPAESGEPESGEPEGGEPENGVPEGGASEGGEPEGGEPEGGEPEDGASEGGRVPLQTNNQFKNWARAHNIRPSTVAKGALKGTGRAIKGTAKFATKTAFKAGVGTLAGAVALATGGGAAGAFAAATAGAKLGDKLGTGVTNIGGKAITGIGKGIGKGAGRLATATYTGIKQKSGAAFADKLLGGTALGREIDLAYGNERFQDIGNVNAFMKDKNNIKYLQDKLTAENNGQIPSVKDVKKYMQDNNYRQYAQEGLTNIKDVENARKAEKYGVSAEQAAKIAAIGKEKGITKDILDDEKKYNATKANMEQEFINKGRSQAEAQRMTDYTLNVLKAQNGSKHNLKKKA